VIPKSPGPGIRDWLLFAIGVTFVAGSLILLRDKPRDALMPLTFFGVCTITLGFNIYRKLGRRRFTATRVSVAGGVKLRGSNARMLLLAAGIGIPGITIFLVESPIYIYVCGGIMLAASAWLLFAVASGRIASRFIRFDPPGLTIGEWSYEYFIPWDEIVDVAEFEVVDNASVGFDVLNPDAILVKPESFRAAVLKGFANNKGLSDRCVVFMARHFAVPAEALAAALANYSSDRDARAELVARPALPEKTR